MNYKGLDKFRERALFVFIGYIIGVIITINYYSHNTNSKEQDNYINSLVEKNDSIKIKIEKLDSIKNAKIIEVSTLNNDSTLKLFYKLVSE